MSDPLVPPGDGHTTLSDVDRVGLIPTYIATRGELFAVEQQNIADALLRRRRPSVDALLDDRYLRELHKAMFGQVWEWAGRYRLRETNIGIDPKEISAAVRRVVDDTKAWIEYSTYDPDELATRFHHLLVLIHPFPNGNGRHGRLAADYLIQALGRPPFSWGAKLDADTKALRAAYRESLISADKGDISALLTFARA